MIDELPWLCCVGLWRTPFPSHVHAAALEPWGGSGSGSSGGMETLFERSALTPILTVYREVGAGEERKAEGKLGEGMAHCFFKCLLAGVSCADWMRCLFWYMLQKAHIDVSSFTDQLHYEFDICSQKVSCNFSKKVLISTLQTKQTLTGISIPCEIQRMYISFPH